jgi:hypothetical protein
MSQYSDFVKKLVEITTAQHALYSQYNEGDEELCNQIEKYWTSLGYQFHSCTSNDYPWSAVFVSYCVKKAGASNAEFLFSQRHAEFVHQAIRNADSATGVFQAVPVDEYAPEIGDIIQMNRGGNDYGYEYARNHNDYISHTAIVVEFGKNIFGHFAITIGGNENDSIRRDKVKLNSQGFIKQRNRNPYISIIKTLK